jgi:hypothetical protein
MPRLIVLTLGGALALATAASAQVSGIVTSETLTTYQPLLGATSGGPNAYGMSGPIGNQTTQINTSYFGTENYNNYQVSTTVNPDYIAFANNGTVSGLNSYVQSSTSIAVTYTNTTSTAVNATLTSTILPGGFGFYEGNLAGNPTYSNGVVADVNQTPESKTANLLSLNGYFPTASWQVGAVAFSFEILDGSSVLADYTGSATLDLLENCTETGCSAPYMALGSVSGTATTELADFGLIAADSAEKAIGWSWDATTVSLALGTLGAGASTTLTYLTTVTVETDINKSSVANQALIAYAGFGDPIGKEAGAGGINDPNFPLLDLSPPTFNPVTGDATSPDFINYGPDIPPNDVTVTPEPQTWALMLAGVGLAGAVLRRRARRATA